MPKRRVSRKKRGGMNSSALSWSKTITTNPIYTRTIRYHATAAFASYITARCVLNSYGGWRNIASAEFLIAYSAIRIRRVALFYESNGTFGSAAGEVSLTAFGEHAPEDRKTSRGTAFRPGHIVWRPKKSYFADLWYNLQDNIEAVLFNCVLPADGFMDLTFQFTLAEGTDTNAIAATSPAADAYAYPALDNSTVAPALAGLLLRADDLFYIALTGVTTEKENQALRRKEVLNEVIDGIIEEEDREAKNKILKRKNNKEESSS